MTTDVPEAVLKLVDGLHFRAGKKALFALSPTIVRQGEWVAFIPDVADPVTDTAGPLSQVLNTVEDAVFGAVELLGHHIGPMEYGARLRLRSQLGFVHSYGGLLSNRTLYENLALPVSVHGDVSVREESRLVRQAIEDFALEQFSLMQPHEMDGATRWRSCLARALILNPRWLVLEGVGDWEVDRGQGVGWQRLHEIHRGGKMATAICLPRQNAGFAAWFLEHGGRIIRYTQIDAQKPEENL